GPGLGAPQTRMVTGSGGLAAGPAAGLGTGRLAARGVSAGRGPPAAGRTGAPGTRRPAGGCPGLGGRTGIGRRADLGRAAGTGGVLAGRADRPAAAGGGGCGRRGREEGRRPEQVAEAAAEAEPG